MNCKVSGEKQLHLITLSKIINSLKGATQTDTLGVHIPGLYMFWTVTRTSLMAPGNPNPLTLGHKETLIPKSPLILKVERRSVTAAELWEVHGNPQ